MGSNPPHAKTELVGVGYCAGGGCTNRGGKFEDPYGVCEETARTGGHHGDAGVEWDERGRSEHRLRRGLAVCLRLRGLRGISQSFFGNRVLLCRIVNVWYFSLTCVSSGRK